MEKFDYDNLLNNIRIIQEFHISFTNKRADYLLVYENKIIIVAFSYNKFDNEDYHYNIKLKQLIRYKKLIVNILPKNNESNKNKPLKKFLNVVNNNSISKEVFKNLNACLKKKSNLFI